MQLCISPNISSVPVQKKINLEIVKLLASLHLTSPCPLLLLVGLIRSSCLEAEPSITSEFRQQFIPPCLFHPQKTLPISKQTTV